MAGRAGGVLGTGHKRLCHRRIFIFHRPFERASKRGALLPPERAGTLHRHRRKGMMVMRTLLMPSPHLPAFFMKTHLKRRRASASGFTSVNSAPNELIEDSLVRPPIVWTYSPRCTMYVQRGYGLRGGRGNASFHGVRWSSRKECSRLRGPTYNFTKLADY